MRAETKGNHGMGKRFAIVMKRRIRIAAASLMVAAGLITAVAAPASAGSGLYSWEITCESGAVESGGAIITQTGIGTKADFQVALQAFKPACDNGTLKKTLTRLPVETPGG